MRESVLEKRKVDFHENLSSDFRKISHEHAPRPGPPNGVTSYPPPESWAEPGGPEFWGDPPQISYFRYPGVENLSTISSAPRSLQKLGV